MDIKWNPIGHEFRRIRSEFVETYGDKIETSDRAEKAIFGSLEAGMLIARTLHHQEDQGGELASNNRYILDDGTIERRFWARLSSTSVSSP